ncbi:galactose-1-phosphate uridylyltransferase, partial [Streptomyces sp. SID7499]|nr:galactose-1-phosphate uridylyltransferase [Streptomyces sp. SID7499]
MKKTVTTLADGRELIYYDSADDTVRDAVDHRPLDPVSTSSEIRRDPLLGDAVAIASHRQARTYHP